MWAFPFPKPKFSSVWGNTSSPTSPAPPDLAIAADLAHRRLGRACRPPSAKRRVPGAPPLRSRAYGKIEAVSLQRAATDAQPSAAEAQSSATEARNALPFPSLSFTLFPRIETYQGFAGPRPGKKILPSRFLRAKADFVSRIPKTSIGLAACAALSRFSPPAPTSSSIPDSRALFLLELRT
jgi:hypothetical protein